VSVSMELVKQLRDKTNASIMSCKRAIEDAQGDINKAMELLRTWGMAIANKKASRVATEGVVFSYIHPGNRIGVLVEVNSETDFVARNKEFNDFVKEISMQIAATNPRYILREEIPPEVIENEKKIYAAQIDGTNKNEKILQKIIEGKLEKFYSEVCLIEQPYIRDESVKIKELLDIIIAKFGENIVIRRFVRFQLGEELAKKL